MHQQIAAATARPKLTNGGVHTSTAVVATTMTSVNTTFSAGCLRDREACVAWARLDVARFLSGRAKAATGDVGMTPTVSWKAIKRR
jgi:hypothetical protein